MDVLVSKSDFDDAVEISKTMGFSPRLTSKSDISKLAIAAAENPRKALLLLFNTPSQVRSLVSSAAKETVSIQPETPYQKACKNDYAYQLTSGEMVLDLKNHLSHVSPMDQKRIRLDPEVERQMLERRNEWEYFYTPDAPDELAHIVTHCVFEYDGEFPRYYQARCETLKEEMSESEWQLFEEVLSHIYYAASNVVSECVWGGEYDEIRPKLATYSEY